MSMRMRRMKIVKYKYYVYQGMSRCTQCKMNHPGVCTKYYVHTYLIDIYLGSLRSNLKHTYIVSSTYLTLGMHGR